MKKKLIQQMVLMTAAAVVVGALHGVIGWLAAGMDRLHITVPTFWDGFLFCGIYYILNYFIGLILLFTIRSNKFFITRNILLSVVMVFVVEQMVPSVELNWIVTTIYGLSMGFRSIKLWTNNRFRFIEGISEDMIKVLNKVQ